jgi:hypothetical protein
VNVAALEVFNQLSFQHFGIGHLFDTDGDSSGLGHLRGAVTPCTKNNLEAALTGRPHKQGRENALATDGFGLLWR